MIRTAFVFALAIALGACATYREDLNRGQRLYEENEYEHALAIWRMLETDMDSLDQTDQSRYAYLRGMTDYRLGFRPDARHWLAIAKAIEQEHPGGLSPQWKQRLDEALADLNRDVYGGAEAVATTQSTAVETSKPAPVQEGAKTGACTADSDCPSGNRCQEGACVPL